MSATSNHSTIAQKVAEINQVPGFDPAALTVEYTDLNTGEKRFRLPVMMQMVWFRLLYPAGKISATVTLVKDCYVCHARVYHDYMDPTECFLAEATASRKYDPQKSTVSPREWAQTAAIGIALRNAGFGLQFHAAGEAFDQPAVDELGDLIEDSSPAPAEEGLQTGAETPEITPSAATPEQPAQSIVSDQPEETPLEKAMRMVCPLTKDGLKGKTLGELIQLDPSALTWIANKYTKNPDVAEGARLICEHALSATA